MLVYKGCTVKMIEDVILYLDGNNIDDTIFFKSYSNALGTSYHLLTPIADDANNAVGLRNNLKSRIQKNITNVIINQVCDDYITYEPDDTNLIVVDGNNTMIYNNPLTYSTPTQASIFQNQTLYIDHIIFMDYAFSCLRSNNNIPQFRCTLESIVRFHKILFPSYVIPSNYIVLP